MAKWVRAWVDNDSTSYTNAYINLDNVRLIKVVRNVPDTAWTVVVEYNDATTEYLYAGTADLQETCDELKEFLGDTQIGEG